MKNPAECEGTAEVQLKKSGKYPTNLRCFEDLGPRVGVVDGHLKSSVRGY